MDLFDFGLLDLVRQRWRSSGEQDTISLVVRAIGIEVLRKHGHFDSRAEERGAVDCGFRERRSRRADGRWFSRSGAFGNIWDFLFVAYSYVHVLLIPWYCNFARTKRNQARLGHSTTATSSIVTRSSPARWGRCRARARPALAPPTRPACRAAAAPCLCFR